MEQTEQQTEGKKKKKGVLILVILLLAVTAIAIGVAVWALFFRQTENNTLAPDYAPQELEENAEPISEDSTEKLEAPAGGGAVTLMYQNQVTVDLSDETATFLYGNPGESTMNIVLQIVIQDRVIAQSGRLEPGNQVSLLNLQEGIAEQLEPGGYDGKYVLSFYDPDSEEKSAFDTEIPVSVTVTE